MKKLRFSLIHASYEPFINPLVLRDYWYKQAEFPQRLKHYLAFEDADTIVLDFLKIDEKTKLNGVPYKVDELTIATSTRSEMTPSAVRNWNAAAKFADGEVMIVMSDDTAPPPNWDSQLENLMFQSNNLGPKMWVISDDRCPSDSYSFLPRHPVMNREFYLRKGHIFDSQFHGRGADDDLLMTTIENSELYDGTSFRLHHTTGPILDANGTLNCKCGRITKQSVDIFSKSQYRIRQVSQKDIHAILRQRHSWRIRKICVLLSNNDFCRRSVFVKHDKRIIIRNQFYLLLLYAQLKLKVGLSLMKGRVHKHA